jgi:hypothetical protein
VDDLLECVFEILALENLFPVEYPTISELPVTFIFEFCRPAVLPVLGLSSYVFVFLLPAYVLFGRTISILPVVKIVWKSTLRVGVFVNILRTLFDCVPLHKLRTDCVRVRCGVNVLTNEPVFEISLDCKVAVIV